MLSFCRQRQIQRHWQRHEPGNKGITGEIAKSHVSWCALSRQRQDMEVKEARPFHQSGLPQVMLMFCWHAILDLCSLQFSCLVCLTFTTTTVQVIAMIQNIPIARAISSCLSWIVVFEQNKCNKVVFETFYEIFVLLLLLKLLWNLTFAASPSQLSSPPQYLWLSSPSHPPPHCPERRESVFMLCST